MKRFYLTFIVLSILLAASGCSLTERNENVQAGMEAVAASDYDAALESFNAALEAGEDERLAYRGSGLALMGKMQYIDAIAAFEKALALSNGIPNYLDYDINYYIATAFYKTDQKGRAIEAYNAILNMREKEGDAYYLRGAIKVEQGRIEEARADFDQALALNTEGSDRLIEIYKILDTNGYHSIGIEYLRATMEQDEPELANLEKGRISYYLGEYENARMYLERARDTSYTAVLYLGKTYEVLGDYHYAVSVYRAYLDAGNQSPEIYNQLGICRFNMFDYEGALEAFLAGMAIEDNNILQTLRFNEIVVYEYLGDFKKAAVLMDGYLRTYPDDPDAIRENYFLRTR